MNLKKKLLYKYSLRLYKKVNTETHVMNATSLIGGTSNHFVYLHYYCGSGYFNMKAFEFFRN